LSGFSISNNLIANQIELNLNENQSKLSSAARDLSSGERINTAADDPSGNAIATSLGTHAQAFTVASQNVTTAQNAVAVADGALATITDILLRIRSLAVEAASSIQSTSDRDNEQTEIDQLLLEINRISQNTNFNGEALLNGSHSGFQPQQSASATVTANTVLLSATPGSNVPSDNLIASTSFFNSNQQPIIAFSIDQNVLASPVAQTVKVASTLGIEAGSSFSLNGAVITVQSVDAATSTITAVFSTNVALGDVASSAFSTTLTGPVSVGTQTVTLSSAEPIYAGETLTINAGTADSDVVLIQQVLSPTSFIATFNKAQAPGAVVAAGTSFPVGGTSVGPGTVNFSVGVPPIPIYGAANGSTAYIVETSGAGTQVIGTGTVVGGSITNSLVNFPTQIMVNKGDILTVYESAGVGEAQVVNSIDGTIKMQVVNTGTSIAVQETFYGTAAQAAQTSSTLLAPGQTSSLFDGVFTTLGNFGAGDVGSTAYIKVLQSTAAITMPAGPALQVQSGDDEGDTIMIGIPAVNTATLRISNSTVIGSNGNSNDPTLAAEDTIGQTDFGIETVLSVRADLGSFVVRLGMESNNDQQTAINLTASESSIADINVGAETTTFTEAEVEVQMATSLLEQANNLPEQVLKLFR
jgi:flagellin